MALNNSLSTTMTFKPLISDEYLELAATITLSTSVAITTTKLEIADSLLYQERTRQCELLPPDERKAKRQRLQVLPHKKYQALAYRLREILVTCTHESHTLMTIDTTLRAFRAQQRADAPIDLTDPTTPTTGDCPRRTHTTIPANQGGASNHTGRRVNNKQEVVQTTGNSPDLQMVPQTHINDETFLTTITTQYPGASTDIPLTCTYDNNPQATLTAALSILGTTLPTEVLQKMFQHNPTRSGSTLAAILKENNADKHFQSEEYNTAVVNRNLTPGLNAFFLGHSGPNFGKTDENTDTFNNNHLILCQID
jgi:hypothetical protein